jgi:hypothetical protein
VPATVKPDVDVAARLEALAGRPGGETAVPR